MTSKAKSLDNKYLKVAALIKKGMATSTALNKVGMNPSTFYKRAKLNHETPAPTKAKRRYKKSPSVAMATLEVPEADTQKRVAVFVGSPSQVADAIKNLI